MRIFITLALIVVLSGYARAQSDDWCYTLDFKLSNYGAYNVLSGEWVYGVGLEMTSELEFNFDTDFSVDLDRYAVTFVTAETSATASIYDMNVFGSSVVGVDVNLIEGKTTLDIAATGVYSNFYFFGSSLGDSVFIESLALYGTGESPFGQNDCASQSDPAYVYSDIGGQTTRFDYVASAGDVQLSNLLMWLLFSSWGMWIFDRLSSLWGRK